MNETAPLGSRFLAYIVDGLVASLIGALGFLIMYTDGSLTTGTGSWEYLLVMGGILAYTSLDVTRAATLGKMAMGLQIRAADGTPAPKNVLLKRWAFKSAPVLLTALSFLPGVGGSAGTVNAIVSLAIPVSQLFALRASRQTLYDQLVHTNVFCVSR